MTRARIALRKAATPAAGGVALLAVALLVGCGGSEDEPQLTPTTTDTAAVEADAAERQEFIAEADAVCAEVRVEAAELARRAQELQGESGTLEESELLDRASDIWGDQIELIERYHDRFDDLDEPAGDEARMDEMLASIDSGAAIARQVKATLDDGEALPPDLVQTYGGIVAQGNALARAYGFQICGQS